MTVIDCPPTYEVISKENTFHRGKFTVCVITWEESAPFSSVSSSTLRSISEEVLFKSLFCFNISLKRICNLKQNKNC